MDQRLDSLNNWLKEQTSINIERIEPASEDASFRRYFRIFTKNDQYIAMDAPPEIEQTQPFIDVAQQLSKLGLHVPKIHYLDTELGFIVLEDLGTRTYLSQLNDDPQSLYSDAIDALITLQTSVSTHTDFSPPPYSAKLLRQEMDLFRQWYLNKHLQNTTSEASYAVWLHTQQFLINECLEQPQTWVHRDYHSRNLMITNENSPGIIDFQDMVLGPISYDLASLFKDCYIEWPRQKQIEWLTEYYQKFNQRMNESNFDIDQLIRWYDLTGLQRHIKVLGVFCRLNYRDNKAHYLNDLPLVAKYVLDTLPRYPELDGFDAHFRHLIEKSL